MNCKEREVLHRSANPLCTVIGYTITLKIVIFFCFTSKGPLWGKERKEYNERNGRLIKCHSMFALSP